MTLLRAILVCLLLASPARADRHSGSDGERTISARILKVEKGVLHVAIGERGEKVGDVIVPTTDKTEIRLDGQAVKLADLPADALASITQVDGITTVVDCKRPPHRR
jgi:hypothetical protein